MYATNFTLNPKIVYTPPKPIPSNDDVAYFHSPFTPSKQVSQKASRPCGNYHYAENMYNLNNPLQTLEVQRSTQINYNTINQSYPHYYNFMGT
jgi:hypothetical protein